MNKAISFDNMHRVFDPMLSGYSNLVERYYNLVQQGMQPKLAHFLARKYINDSLSREGQKYYSLKDLID